MIEIEALVVSAVIEGPIAFAIVRLCRWPGRGAWHAGLAAIVATAVTHPQLWSAALWGFPRFGYWPTLVGLETLVVAVEGLLIRWMAGLSLRHAMVVSLVANAASCLAGLIIGG